MRHIPNILTMSRLLLIPLYLLVFYSEQPNALAQAISIFVIASITDVLDGYLARTYHVESRFGKVIDPVADKGMQLSVLYTLSDAGYMYPWFFWFILFKEVMQILFGSLIVLKKPNIVVEANYFGKATTVLVFIAIIASVLQWPGTELLQILVVILAGVTLIQYGLKYFKAMKTK